MATEPVELDKGYERFKRSLTLGVVSILEELDGVRDVVVQDRFPVSALELAGWEQRNGIHLPSELRNFYSAADGFHLTWNLAVAGRLVNMGSMHVHRLGDVRRLYFSRSSESTMDLSMMSQKKLDEKESLRTPQFTPDWRLFLIDETDFGKVCLVFPPKKETKEENNTSSLMSDIDVSIVRPQVWLVDLAFEWHFLASDFVTYFRKMIVHLGVPQWQLIDTPQGPSHEAQKLIRLVAPHLLDHKDSDAKSGTSETSVIDAPINREKNQLTFGFARVPDNVFSLMRATSKKKVHS